MVPHCNVASSCSRSSAAAGTPLQPCPLQPYALNERLFHQDLQQRITCDSPRGCGILAMMMAVSVCQSLVWCFDDLQEHDVASLPNDAMFKIQVLTR